MRVFKFKLLLLWAIVCAILCVVLLAPVVNEKYEHRDRLREYADSRVNLDWTIEVYANALVAKESVDNWAYPMLWSEYRYVERVVMAESGNQTIEGQMAVAQCIRNTAEVKGETAYQVVTTPGQYATPQPETVATDSVKEACYRVFHDGEEVVSATIQWFYNPSRGYSKWHESKSYITTIGAHKFFA